MGLKEKNLSPTGEKWLYFAASFLFFAFVMGCAPYSSDDIEFSQLRFDSLSGYLDYALRYGNGRLLGNLCAIALCHSKLLCVVVKAGVLASCVVLIPGLLGCADGLGYAMSFVLLTLIEPAVFGEVYVWTSGFSNYMMPIWLSLLIVRMLQKDRCTPPVYALKCVAVLLMGICSQLFIEHSSGVNLLLALAFVWIAWRKNHKNRWAAVCWLLGTLVGLGLMLAIPRLFYTAGNRVENYRSLNLGSLRTLVYSVAKNGIQLGGHYFGACLVAVCLGSLACIWRTRRGWSEKALRRLTGLTLGALGYLLLSMALATITYRGKSAIIEHTLELCGVLLPLATWFVAAWKLAPSERGPVLGCLAFAVISIAPLLVVTPIPTRVIYQSYVFVALAAMLSAYPLAAALPRRWWGLAKRGLVAAALGIVVIIGSVFASVRFMVTLRDRHIRQCIQRGETTIAIFQLPYTYTSWDHLWSQDLYYGSLTDQELTFEYDGFDNWMHQYWVIG